MKHRKKQLSIIIVNWQREADTLACLRSIALFMKNVSQYDVILVDNASRQGIDTIKREKFSYALTIIENKQNLGFTGGNNAGLREALNSGTPFVLLLNNDTELVDDSIERALEAMIKQPDLAVLGMVNYFHDQPGKIWQAGFSLGVRSGTVHRVWPEASADSIVEVDSVPGSSMMIRVAPLEKAGALDDNFFAYWEDADLCIRLKRDGYKVAFLRESRILHKVKGSTSSQLHLYLFSRNKLYFVKKHSGMLAAVIAGIIMVAKFLMKIVLRKEKRKFRYLMLGIWDFLRDKLGDCRLKDMNRENPVAQPNV